MAIQKRSKQDVAVAGGRYLYGFLVNGSSGQKYKISFDSAPGSMHWTCSCRGHIGHGQCKHLTACGLRGRRDGRLLDIPTPAEGQKTQSQGLLT